VKQAQAAVFFEPEIDHFVMAITSSEARVRQTIPHQTVELPHVAAELIGGRTQMRTSNTRLFAVTAGVLATGFAVWAASPANAPASPSIVQGIEPLQMMVNAKELPTVEYADYTFGFAD
jgi:hypothetical protein